MTINTAAGVDLGGSGWRIARVTPDGPTGPVDRGSWSNTVTLEDVRLVVNDAIRGLHDDGSVGIAVPALVNDGVIQDIPAIPVLRGLRASEVIDLRKPGSARVTLHTDLAAAVAAEAEVGSGRAVDRFMLVMLGTGANVAMFAHGAPVVTFLGCLGDAGHISVQPSEPRCWCGGVGCLEAICSGRALGEAARKLNLHDARELVDTANEGHGPARRVVDGAVRALGRAIAQWSVMLQPDLVAIGGGLGVGLMAHADEIVQEARRIGPTDVVGSFDLVGAKWPYDAPAIGAGLLAIDARGGDEPCLIPAST